MGAEIQKRNTDCVYFLASPLTCKKGNECEYRHSESARLNPRDCYYWLSGNCLNPNCSFRHPPLEGSADDQSDAAHHQNSTVPTNKMNVPCYYYFNAYCMKGDKCPFLHGNDIFLIQNTSKSAKQDSVAQVQEKNPSTRSGSGPALKDAASDGSVKEPFSHAFSRSVPGVTAPTDTFKESSRSPELSLPEVEEPPVKSHDISGSGVEDVNKGADVPSDQSSEELMQDLPDPDELGESSPGFDVLVDDESEHLAYDDDLDYGLGHDRDGERLHHPLIQYNFEGSVGYDPIDYPDSEFLGEVGMHDHFDRFDRRYGRDHAGRNSESSRERVAYGESPHRRDFFGSEHQEEYLDESDLRHRLKRRRAESHHSSYSNQRYRISPRRDLSSRRECCWESMGSSNGVTHHPKQFPDMAGRMIVSSNRRHHAVSIDRYRHRRYMQEGRHFPRRQDRESRPRERHIRRRPFLSSEISGNLNKVDRSIEADSQPVTGFSGPKSLAEIREEKRRQDNGCLAYPSD